MNSLFVYIISIGFGLYISFGGVENISSYMILFTVPLFFLLKFNKINFNELVYKNIYFPFFLIFFIFYAALNNIMNGLGPLSGIFWWVIFLIMINIRIKISNIKKSVVIFTFVSIIVLLIDAYYRFFISTKSLEYGFYAYKYGLIGVDSNFAGLFAMLVFICFDHSIDKSKIKSVVLFVVFLLLFITFSRSAIICTVFYLVFFKLKKTTLVFSLPIFLVFTIPLVFILELLPKTIDESGFSKLELLIEYVSYYSNSSLDLILFGFGLGGLKVGDLNPHLLPLQILTGYGLVGFCLFFGLMGALITTFKSTRKIIIPYLLASFSVAPIGSGVLIFSLYIFIRIEYDRSLLLRRSKLQTAA